MRHCLRFLDCTHHGSYDTKRICEFGHGYETVAVGVVFEHDRNALFTAEFLRQQREIVKKSASTQCDFGQLSDFNIACFD
ncbi:hypothetical protein D1872_300280 [compost metagenome]